MYKSESARAAAREIEDVRKLHAKKYASSMSREPDVSNIPLPLFPLNKPRPLGQVFRLEDVEREMKQRYLNKKQ